MMYFGLHQIQGLIRISCFLSSETTDAPSVDPSNPVISALFQISWQRKA
jgi:hypothetical protein